MGEYDYYYRHPSMDEFLRRSDLRSLKGLSEADIKDAIASACAFFNIPYPVFVQDLSNFRFGYTMFVSIDPTSYGDDILYYNLNELAQLHIGSKQAFSLIVTHEMGHRVLQSIRFEGPYNGSWQGELAADFLMGCRAGLYDMTQIDKVIEGLGKEAGSKSHPKGYLRVNFIKHGLLVAQRIRNERRSVNINDLLEEYGKHYQEMLPYVKKDEKEIYNFFERLMR